MVAQGYTDGSKARVVNPALLECRTANILEG
jgi:hypothetical protein